MLLRVAEEGSDHHAFRTPHIPRPTGIAAGDTGLIGPGAAHRGQASGDAGHGLAAACLPLRS